MFCYYIQALSERHSSLAQSVEHSAVNRVVVGSSPTGGATNKKTGHRPVFLFVFFLFDLCNATEVNSRRLLTGSFSTAPGGRLREKKELSSGQNLSALQAENKFWAPPCVVVVCYLLLPMKNHIINCCIFNCYTFRNRSLTCLFFVFFSFLACIMPPRLTADFVHKENGLEKLPTR